MTQSSGALAGIRVVDLSRILGGPFCAQILADHGADVIKVEPPTGDDTRAWGPPFQDGLSAYFAGANRNKRSIAIDMNKSAGRDIVLRLLETADVVIHNFKSGTLEKWGMGYDDVLSKRFPRLILCHVTGFGNDGPFGGRLGYDAAIQAMSGLMSINGNPKDGPTRVGIPLVDLSTGMFASTAVLAAIIERSRSGLGQAIEVPLFDTALAILHPHAANAMMADKIPVATGNGHPNIVPYDMFPTKTQPLYLAVGNNGQFAKLCSVLGMPEMAEDARYKDNSDRIANRDTVTAILRARLQDEDAEDLEQRLQDAGVPCGVARTVTDALEHPHTQHRKMVVKKGGYRGVGIPAALSRTPGTVRRVPPQFAEHTTEVLVEAGYSKEEVAALVGSNVVQQPKRSTNPIN
jgi:crotonobetainyl-CoA:carnitine CoA-transferase CaiB-like acyl-CoA transferase